MKEIKDEDRIIGRICRGELSITNDDIKNLETANLTEQQEEYFKKLAREINETIDRNQTVRKEMKEKVAVAEKQYGDYLEIIDEEIEYLSIKRDKLRYGSGWSMMLGILIFLASCFIPGIIAGIFTEALWVLITSSMLGSFTSLGFMLYRIYKNSLKSDEFDKKIKQLETKKLCVIEQGNEVVIDLSKRQEDERKSNIVKHIYKSKQIATQNDEELSIQR